MEEKDNIQEKNDINKKINLFEIKKLDPWILIETYFRDNPNFKTQHQIDFHLMNLFIQRQMV